MTVIGINTAALMMLLRVYAMYNQQRSVVAFVAAVFALELGTNAWLLTYGVGQSLDIIATMVRSPFCSRPTHSRHSRYVYAYVGYVD